MNRKDIDDKIEGLADQFFNVSAIDCIGFWQIVPAVRAEFACQEEKQQREIAIEVAKVLIRRGLTPFVFNGNADGSFSTQPWEQRDPDAVADRIEKEWSDLSSDLSPPDICWFKRKTR